jgi:methylated-DNA-protein-cysteine methyltransferase-like protein
MKSVKAKPTSEHAAILRVIRAIPPGCVASYGEVAERAGLPRRARLVGRVLGEWAAPDLPWFRVLRSNGRIAFEKGSQPFRKQVRLLAAEGVLVVGGRVDIAIHGWDRNLDAALWAPPPPVRKKTPPAPRKPAKPRSRR